jgi:hypothetical protein
MVEGTLRVDFWLQNHYIPELNIDFKSVPCYRRFN